MMKVLASHEADDLNVTVYKQIWNEPDLTSYFNYSAGGTTFFHGTNADYNAMYESASTAMAVRNFACIASLLSLCPLLDFTYKSIEGRLYNSYHVLEFHFQ